MKKILSILLVLIVVLTACSSSNETTEELSYESELGTISYKKNPRIYADYYVGQLLYLDANLVAADLTYPSISWQDIVEERGVKNISGDMEAVAVEKPDLIITINKDQYDQFSQIAPTIYLDYNKYTNPEDMLTEIGKIVNKEDEAAAWIKQFNENIDKLKKEIDHPEYEVGITEAWGDAIYMYGENYGRGGYIIYNKLGLKGTEKAEDKYIHETESYLQVDGESILDYVGDVLFIVQNSDNSENANDDQGVDTIKALPTYDDMEPVKNDRAFVVDGSFPFVDPYALDDQVESLMEIYSSPDL